ncbi:uncharacterized protein LOC117600594 [Osmia lignaria lignaria]|uniref:uncharacterized protein LOC117600594 n=1 Tax=Osmia lignaria lignaria TaxID=1437193 RepID=UPI001478F42E|nr:uncharacterized protein LOC117600594 [Osmia lignaria]
MIEKNEENTDSDNNIVRIRLITDKRTVLEKQFLQVQEEIKICFAQLAQTLYAREKQLLRQSEAIYRQQISLALSSQEILPPSVAVLDEKNALEEQIKQFGRIELKGSNSTAITNLEPYKIEEYQDISKDHVCFDKSIKNTEIISSNTNTEFSSTMENKNMQNTSCGLRTSSVTNLIGNSSQIFNFQDKNSQEDLHNSKMDIEFQKNDFNLQVVGTDQQENETCKNSTRNIIEEQHNSYGHTEQVQQWLDQILLETEIEPTIHEVEKLPEISDTYICTKLQLET